MKVHWKPHPGPQTLFLQAEDIDEKLYGGGRGSGKTDAGIVWSAYPDYVRHPRYRGLVIRQHSVDLSDWVDRAKWMFAPMKAIFTGNPPIISFPTGAVIRTGHLADADAYTKYQGHEYQRILIEEASHIASENLFEKLIASCRSTIPELKPRIALTSNPDGIGAGWLKRRFHIVSGRQTVFTTPIGQRRMYIPATLKDNPSLLQDDGYVRRLNAITDPELRKAWLEGDWDAFGIKGSYYGDLAVEMRKQGRIMAVPWEKLLPVSVWMDLGMDDSMTLGFFQFFGPQKRMIDYYEMTGEGLEHYAEVMRQKEYRYDTIWLPHDANVRELGTGKTRYEVLKALMPGLNIRFVPRVAQGTGREVQEGIQAVRSTLPSLWIDAVKCAGVVECLENYRHEWDELLQVFRPSPVHDRFSHGADMMRYFSVTCQLQAMETAFTDYSPQGMIDVNYPFHGDRLRR